MSSYYKILSIDGGGVRGLIPSVVLAELEARIGKPLHKVFDLVAGTSTGAIIAAGLTAPSPSGPGAAFSAADLVELFMKDGGKIFYSPLYKRVSFLDDLVERKFDHKPLERILKAKLGNARVKDALKELLITSYDMHAGSPYFFKRWRAREKPGKRDHALWQAVRASSAAPTFFEPFHLKKASPKYDKSLVDGGVFANNPAMCAYTEGVKRKPAAKTILLVSLGTGDPDFGRAAKRKKYPYAKAKDWGVIGWARPVINIMMDGVTDTVDHQMRHVLVDDETARPSKPQTYFRFQTGLTDKTRDMDDANNESLKALKRLGARLASKYSGQLDQLAQVLTA